MSEALPSAPAQPSASPPREGPAFEAWNEAMVSKYDNDLYHRNPSWLVRYVETRRVRQVLELLECRRADRVLEVGCGAGHLLAQVPSDQRTGVDLSAQLLAKARARCGPGVRIEKANAEALPFEPASFERVYCSEVLEHVLDPGRVVAEIARVVTPGGRVVLSIPVDRTIIRAKRWLKALGLYGAALGRAENGQYRPPDTNEWHLHHLDLERLRALTRDRLVEVRLKAIPNRLLPVHYVTAYKRAPEAGGGS